MAYGVLFEDKETIKGGRKEGERRVGKNTLHNSECVSRTILCERSRGKLKFLEHWTWACCRTVAQQARYTQVLKKNAHYNFFWKHNKATVWQTVFRIRLKCTPLALPQYRHTKRIVAFSVSATQHRFFEFFGSEGMQWRTRVTATYSDDYYSHSY